ncbi:hypothetical protein GGI43DRAFT_426889 [Trichoderma evansii]
MSSIHFSNTILAPSDTGQILQTIGIIDQPRKKRPHCKSRRGCIACKRRRVKCDEHLPCSSCIKRNIQCLQPLRQHVVSPTISIPSIHLEMSMNPQINLLHLELFHHWDKETRSTLVFPQIWPIILQRAFTEDFVMSAILCVAAMHLSTLCPQNPKYSHAAMQLMGKTIQLFRKNLSRPLTKDNCEILMGAALLVNYMSWFDIGFMDEDRTVDSAANSYLAQDQLFLLSPGIIQLWFQAIPIFIDEGSIFAQIVYKDPRLKIEETLRKRGEDPARFVAPFMTIWDNPRYQSEGCTTTNSYGPTSYAWRLLLGLDMELPCRGFSQYKATSVLKEEDESSMLLRFKDAITKITTNYTSSDQLNTPVASSSYLIRSSFANIVRRLSPLLCCVSFESPQNTISSGHIESLEEDIEQLFYGFPILCCGPFSELIMKSDSRALVFLFHFYRAARTLLPAKKCWWAYNRSRSLQRPLLKELSVRGIDPCL